MSFKNTDLQKFSNKNISFHVWYPEDMLFDTPATLVAPGCLKCGLCNMSK